MKNSTVHFFYLALLICITTLAYSNSFQGPFVFDDFINIINKKSIRIFTPSISGIIQAASDGHSSNRWIPNISFALNYYFGGENVWGYHLVNLLIHLGSTLVLYSLFLAILNSPSLKNNLSLKKEIAFIAALLWAVHPIQTNSVTYLVQRMTSMSTLFFLSSLLCYVLGRLKKNSGNNQYLYYALTLIFGLMSFLCKENAFMLPVMILAVEIFFLRTPDWKNDRKKLIIWGSASIVLIFVTSSILIGPNVFSSILESYNYRQFTLPERLLTETRIIFIYIGLLLFPHPSKLNLCHDVSLSSSIISPPQTLLAIFGILSLVGLLLYSFNKNRLLSFALFWFLGNLLIESTIVPLELIFEHRLYLPSAFLILIFPYTLYQICKSKPWIARTSLTFIVIFLTLWTWQRNQVWGSYITLWSDVMAKSPGLGRGYNNLGVAYHEDGQLQKAQKLFKKAIEIEPESRIAYISLGSLYLTQNRLQEADRILHTALTKEEFLSPSRIYHYLGVLNRKTGKYKEAMRFSKMALHIEQNDLEPMINLGIIKEKLGEYQQADDIFTEIMTLGINSVDLYNNWGIAVYKLGQVDRSIKYFKQALEINPDHPESHYNLGLAYSAKGMSKEARDEMQLSMELQQKKQDLN